MKDTEFIELLNLYLDRELTPADCARLEAEIKANPARRRTYAQYCRMQQGCKALAADFAADAPAATTEKIFAFEATAPARGRPIGLFAVGSLAAAAACVAFVLLGRAPQGQPGNGAVAAAPVALQTESMPVVAEAQRAGGIVQRSSLMGDTIFLTRAAPADNNAAVAPQLAWIQDVQVTPMQQVISAEQLRFDAQLIKLGGDVRVLGAAKLPGDNVTERAAFEFRR